MNSLNFNNNMAKLQMLVLTIIYFISNINSAYNYSYSNPFNNVIINHKNMSLITSDNLNKNLEEKNFNNNVSVLNNHNYSIWLLE